MDIQKQLQAGKGPGYERWAKVFNLKQMAKTLNYLMEHRLYDWEALEKHVDGVKAEFQKSVEALRRIERKLEENRQMMVHVRNYARTRAVYIAFRECGYHDDFASKFAEDLSQYRAATKFFQQIMEEGKTISKIKPLQIENYLLLQEHKEFGKAQKRLVQLLQDIQNARMNVQIVLHEKNEFSQQKSEILRLNCKSDNHFL